MKKNILLFFLLSAITMSTITGCNTQSSGESTSNGAPAASNSSTSSSNSNSSVVSSSIISLSSSSSSSSVSSSPSSSKSSSSSSILSSSSSSSSSIISSSSSSASSSISGLVARYKFENNANDTTGTYNLSTYSGTPSYSTTVKKEGSYSLYLDGATSLKYSSFPWTSTGITMAAWVYLDSSASATITYPSAVDLLGTSIYCEQATGNLLVSVQNNAVTPAYTGTTFNTWVHAVLTYDGSTMKLYVNGNLISTRSIDLTISGIHDLLISNYYADGTSFWKGYIDDVQIYNRALTAAEITSIYNLN
jgi:hypothetical protein